MRLPLDPARVHPFPASGEAFGDDADAAAAGYAAELATSASDGAVVPRFDVLMLGVGEEGHVASIFPHSEAARSEATIVPVYECPKPPPCRLSMTFPTIGSADEVWLLASGASKAEAAARALGGADKLDVPAAGARGRTRTLWLVDREVADRLPS